MYKKLFMNKVKKSYYLNIAILILEVFSLGWMMSGFKVFAKTDLLLASKFEMVKYFTIDSNLIMGIISLIALIGQRRVLTGKSEKVPSYVGVFKLLGTTGVVLTMLVTLFFLVPTMGIGVAITDANLFLHVINPIISIICFVLYEKSSNIKFKHTITACLPLVFY